MCIFSFFFFHIFTEVVFAIPSLLRILHPSCQWLFIEIINICLLMILSKSLSEIFHRCLIKLFNNEYTFDSFHKLLNPEFIEQFFPDRCKTILCNSLIKDNYPWITFVCSGITLFRTITQTFNKIITLLLYIYCEQSFSSMYS